jgi:hypothetical protein
MEFMEDKVREYLLGDTGGKRFPTGTCPSFKDWCKQVLGSDVKLWPMQKLILKVIINTMHLFEYLPLTEWEEATLAEMILNGQHPDGDNRYRQAVVRYDPHSSSPVVILLLIGRGGSKSFMSSLLVSYFIRWLLSWKHPHKRFKLAKTKPIAIQCLAGKESQAVSLFRSVKTHLRNSEELQGCYDEFKESVNFGNVIEARAYTSNSDTVRGEDTFCYYHEETAFCSEDNTESEKSFTQCYRAIQPAVKNRFGKEGVMIFVTSAGLKIGKTYQLYRQIRNGTIKNCVMFQLAVWEMGNPKYGDGGKQHFAQEYAEDPITADAEHGSQFVDAVNVFLTPDEVWRPIKGSLEKRMSGDPAIEYWIRLDPSRKHDRYALSLGHKEYRKEGNHERIVAVVDYVCYWQAKWFDRESGEEITNATPTQKSRLRCEPVNPQMVLEHIEQLLEKFNVVGVSSDQFESQYIIDELNERYGSDDDPFGFINPITEKSNWLAYRNHKKLINTDCFEIYQEDAYIEEASVAMRYNKNKPLETRPDELIPGGWEEDDDPEGIDEPNLIYSVQAPRNGMVKTDDVLDAVVFCNWDMMTNAKMGVAGLDLLTAGGTRDSAKLTDKFGTHNSRTVQESPLMELPDRW